MRAGWLSWLRFQKHTTEAAVFCFQAQQTTALAAPPEPPAVLPMTASQKRHTVVGPSYRIE